MPRIARIIALIGLGTLVGDSFAISLPRGFLGDVAVFIGSGRLAALGQNPYGVADITPRGPDGVPFPNLSPPVSVLLFQQIAWIDPISLFRVWYACNLVLYVLVIIALVRAHPQNQPMLRLMWALAIFPLWFTIAIGQVHVVLLLLATVVWLALRSERDDLAGLALGVLIAFKPNFLLWPILLLLAGRRRTSFVSVGTAGVLSVWPALVYGPGIYVDWLDASARTTSSIGGYGVLSFLAHDLGQPWLGLPLSAAIAIGAVAWVWRTRPKGQRVSEVALIVSLLALPVTNAAYFLLLVPVFLTRRWTVATAVAGALLLVPWQFIVTSRLPWPYAIVLTLLLGYPPGEAKIRSLIFSARLSALRQPVASDA